MPPSPEHLLIARRRARFAAAVRRINHMFVAEPRFTPAELRELAGLFLAAASAADGDATRFTAAELAELARLFRASLNAASRELAAEALAAEVAAHNRWQARHAPTSPSPTPALSPPPAPPPTS